VEPEELLAAQRADHEDMEAFRESFRALVQKAIDLPPDAGSDQVLALKEDLERHYEEACGLPDEHVDEKNAIAKLIGLISTAVRRATGGDPLAQRELQDEEEARAIHFRLLEHPLAADILHPQSPIGPAELTPSVLSATPGEVDAVLEIFDAAQLMELLEGGRDVVRRLEATAVDTTDARQRLAQVEARLSHPRRAGMLN
jgi:hypothetical protein